MNTKKSESRGVAKLPHDRRTGRFQQLVKMAAMLLLLLAITAKTHGQSALDGFDPNANGAIIFVVTQPNGKTLISGSFTTVQGVTRNGMARLNADGTLDTTFDPNPNDFVTAMAVQADGKILAGGNFTSIGGQLRNRIARLDATTGLADSFNPNSSFVVYAIAVQADGKILAGGDFMSIGGQPRRFLARLDAATGQADSFDANANNRIDRILLQRDGKILVSGLFNSGFGEDSIGGQPRNRMARLDPATGLADSFNPNPSNNILTMALQADDKVLAGGQFGNIGGQSRNRIARLDATTGLADSFNPDANQIVYSIVVQPDGKILAGGLFDASFGNSIGGQPRNHIARLDAVTGLADSFDPNADDFVYAIATQGDGKVIAGGEFTSFAPNGGATVTRNRIARLETDGRLDQTLNLGIHPGGVVLATALQPDGKILVGGGFATMGVARNHLVRLNTDGTLDTVFDPNANNIVESIAVQADGKILVGGNFTSIGGQTRNRIARLNATTGSADSFDPDANSRLYSIAVQVDGKILVGGNFFGADSVGGQTRNFIARLDPTTGFADSFNPNASNIVESILVQADGKILVGGLFSTIGGQSRNSGIARLDATTGLADSFDPSMGSGGAVEAISVQADGKILAGGQFSFIGGQARNRIARFDATMGLADSFDPNANGVPLSIAVQSDGKVLAGGEFNNIGGQPRSFVARLDSTTGLADSFDPNANNTVNSIAAQADGKILAGGFFGTIGGQTRSRFARLSNDTAALQNLAVTQATVTWTRDGSSPQFTRATFEYSNDNANYTPLGNGTTIGGTWTLTGLDLPVGQNIYIRARGYYRSGQHNGSESITESVRNAFLAGSTGTPTPTPTTTPSPSPTPPGPSPTLTATVPPSPTPPGTPTPTPTASPTPPSTPTASPTPPATPTPGVTPTTLGNISTRLRVETGDNVLIGGFIVTGTQPKKIIVRAIGPSLPLAGALADPVLELRNSSGALIRSNENWRDDPAQESEINATGIPPSNDLEAAIVETLSANGSAYTAIVRGLDNGTGIGVVEAYDLDQTVNSKLANISTRGLVQTGDDVLIGGLIVLGQNQLRVIVRAIGPSLPFPGTLADPTLNLHDGNGTLVASNNNWREDPVQESAIIATGIPPSDDRESAMVHNLTPGSYTAIVRGVNNTTGIAVVEAYGLN